MKIKYVTLRQEVDLPNKKEIEKMIEACFARSGLIVTLKGTLSTYHGSIHWHLKKDGESKGTLELTLWLEKRLLWFSIQSGRRGKWISSSFIRALIRQWNSII